MRGHGTARELEARRRGAVRLVAAGRTQKEVAAALGVHPVTVAKWMARYRAAGVAGVVAKPTPGRPRLLTADQERQVFGWLAVPPSKNGAHAGGWTARRLAERIRVAFAVEFDLRYLRAWLKRRKYRFPTSAPWGDQPLRQNKPSKTPRAETG